MIDSLALAITLTCLLVALGALAATVTGRFRAERFAGALLVVETALVLQLIGSIVGLRRGHRLSEPATFVAYLVFSVLVLPVAVSQVRGTVGRWAGGVVVAALVVQAVVVVRLQTVWRHA
ncbi:hypothetical protein SAMN05443575_4269 [Jatrophihabitans endophyticus]|uniref:Uncharacterized protein n=1 Tax=Jatrophihabitans endophyticus TaxID=1206085 RepID=A0A1M5UQI7_9ACTN|nr:hypothetical protein [Jatrophihabitans endophyticus]SHH64923.1 hypothetical protein SAMN05443575_4269 [Jatrophihabitans endophyticus]